jgi:hypothetical protein
MICTSCGVNNRDDAQFCRGCGTALGNPFQNPAPPPNPTAPPPNPAPNYPGYQSQFPQHPPQYGGGYQAPMPAGASGKAIASLVLSIISIFASPCTFVLPIASLFSIAGLVLGKLEMTAIAQGQSSQAGLGYAKAGFWIGVVMTALNCLGFLVLMALGMLSGFLQSMQ